MRSYGKVSTQFWHDERIRSLPEAAQVLALYILTSPHGNAVGCFMLPDGYIQADLRWPAKRVAENLALLIEAGFIERDEKSGLTRLPKWWKHNTIENPKVGRSIEKIVEALPDKGSPLVKALIASLEPFAHRFSELFAKQYLKPSAIPYQEPYSEPSRYPEPKPEPEPEQQPHIGSGDGKGKLIVQAFDDALAKAFGEDKRRAWPRQDDLVFANRWIEHGASFELLSAIFEARMPAAAAAGRKPPAGLKYFEGAVAEALDAAKRPMQSANGHANGAKPKVDPTRFTDEEWRICVRSLEAGPQGSFDQPWPAVWRKPPVKGKWAEGCLVPKHIQREFGYGPAPEAQS